MSDVNFLLKELLLPLAARCMEGQFSTRPNNYKSDLTLSSIVADRKDIHTLKLIQHPAILPRMKKAFLFSLLLHFLTNALCVYASSGCQMCASTGNCYAAFRNSPGQFCGYFHDYGFETKPCCCPNDTICNLSPFECLCHVPDRRYVPPTPDYNYDFHYNGEGLGSLIFFILLCCCCMCCCSACGNSEQESGYIPVAVPATGDAPSYQKRSGGWGPALGGFALGQMIGEGGGHHHHHHHGGGHNISGDTGGGFGFGGGSDIRGDTGGGFSFGGDSGGGGFGFGGGGGHDIRGDS